MPDMRLFFYFLLLHCSLFITSKSHANDQPFSAEDLVFFEKKVRPLLAEHCYQCHSVDAKRIEANLLLDSRVSHLKGGDSGPTIVPGNASSSLLIEAVHYDSYEMPPKGKLSEQDIQTLTRWVDIGAPWPEEPVPSKKSVQEFDLESRKNNFWVWQPMQTPDLPQIHNAGWVNNEIDSFILSQLEQAHIKPSQDAERTAILRRLYFDLIGLPPTTEEVKAFIENKNPQATEHVVNQLLESPHFGERWGRHWLDIVRYAESRGHEFDNDTPNAFQYRDYVIRALNADVPYDQFVREHIAGDLLPNPRLHPKEHFNESILGTGFWFLGEWVHSPVDIRKDEADRFDNMIDVFSKTFLGVTVACARCHDHKYDAISTADYYSLSGFLQSSDYRQVRFESMEQNRKTATELADINTTHQRQIRSLLESRGIRTPDSTRAPNMAPRLTDDPIPEDSILFDYSNLPKDDFLQDGFIFGISPRRAGEPYLDSSTGHLKISTFDAAVNDPVWNGLESITEGAIQNQSKLTKLPKSGRTLRSPTFELKDGEVHCLVDGTGHIVACVDSHRLVAGPLHQQTVVRFKEGQRWVRLNLDRYVGHRVHLEFIPEASKQIAVRLAVQGLSKNEVATFEERINAGDRKYEEYAKTAEAILNNNTETETERSAHTIVSSWKREQEQLASQIVRTSRLALSMMDGTGENDRILIRGNSAKPGQIEPRHFLTAISGDKPLSIEKGSGRLQLAELVNDPTNPLTSRVIVNRIWHHLMGRGIVPTTDDFGFLGQRPTHPRLLDHLATRFLQEGRSIKSMIKYIVLSRTYQMSSHANQKAQELDPSNLLWHHCPPRRLQGEAIRDSLLTLSGRLDITAFGPPVPIHLTSFMNGRGRPKESGSLDGDGRRSIYISVRRNFLSPFMLAFDTPTPFSSMGRRNVSNVPAQPLILLNDPLVVELADDWSKQAAKNTTGTGFDATSNRIEWMYLSAFGRYPTEQETATSLAFLSSKTSDNKAFDFDETCWSELAHALVNTKEFIFLR